LRIALHEALKPPIGEIAAHRLRTIHTPSVIRQPDHRCRFGLKLRL